MTSNPTVSKNFQQSYNLMFELESPAPPIIVVVMN